MRIITGAARGRRLETLPGDDTRPTAERVKEALFSALQFELEGRRVLDAFAGSGQLGLEALSRGAASCVFTDKNPAAVEVIRRNLQTTGLAKNAQVLCVDTLQFLTRPGLRFDLVLLDPPYAAGLLLPALTAAAGLLDAGGIAACECDSQLELPEAVGRLALSRRYRYGKTNITLYRMAEASA